MRYFLELAYNGTSFHGWQIQPNADSVQETIENALSVLFQRPVPIIGAGRTDTGVHARKMYAHFDVEDPIENTSRFLLSLRSLVGRNISIKNIIEVPVDAHARFDATSRTYKYFISFQRNPFLKDLMWFSPTFLEMEKMNLAASILIEAKDFTSFAKLHSDAKTNICKVTKAEFLPLNKDKEARDFIGTLEDGIVFTITSDRFLRNMVRAIVGTLVEVGKGKISYDDFRAIMEEKNRSAAGTSMPPQALFLWDIVYPYIT